MGDDSDLNLLRAEICLAPGGGRVPESHSARVQFC
jgi:hypothetical protein